MARYNISKKANDPNYVSPYKTGNGKYQGDGGTNAVDQTKRTGRGTKESPLTDIQMQDLSSRGIKVGDTFAGKGVLNAGGFFTPASGITTSGSASKAVENARNTLNKIGSNTGTTSSSGGSDQFSQLSQLLQQLNDTRLQLQESKKSEETAKKNLTDADLQSKLDALGTSQEGGTTDTTTNDGTATDTSTKKQDTTSNVNSDPFLQGIVDNTLNTVATIQAQVTRLDSYRKTMSDYAQQEVDDISATAARAVQRQTEENARVKRAIEFAGVVGGRAQFSPVVENTLIHEVIQNGLDKIDVIEQKKNEAIRTARKAETEFDYKLFTDSVQLAQDYNTAIENGMSKLRDEVRQQEKDEQDRLTFNQEQQDRSALILAGELTDATPEQIAQTAAANGIDVGLLTKAVNDAKYEQSNRSLTLEQQRANINKTNNAIRLANEKAASTTNDKSMTVTEIKQFSDRNGWTPPQGMTTARAQAINGGLRVFPESVREEYATLSVTDPEKAKKYLDDKTNKAADVGITAMLNQPDMASMKGQYKQAAKTMGISDLLPWNSFKEVAKTDAFKKAYADTVKENQASIANDEGSTFVTNEEFLQKILDKTLANDKKLKEKIGNRLSDVNSKNQTKTSTKAVSGAKRTTSNNSDKNVTFGIPINNGALNI